MLVEHLLCNEKVARSIRVEGTHSLVVHAVELFIRNEAEAVQVRPGEPSSKVVKSSLCSSVVRALLW